jgi:hypothetical protein
VTAELALAMPTLMVVLLAGLYMLAALAATGRCADAARTLAREVARGDDAAAAEPRVLAVLPPGSAVTWARVATATSGGQATVAPGGLVSVTVSAPLPAPSPLAGLLRDRRLHATVTTADETAPAPAG